MKIKYKMSVVDLDGETIAVPVTNRKCEFNGVLRMNETGARILSLLAEDTTVDRIVEQLMQEYDESEDVLRSCTANIIETLRKGNLIEE